MVYTLSFFPSSKCSLFHNSNVFGSCIIHILYTECAKIKTNSNLFDSCIIHILYTECAKIKKCPTYLVPVLFTFYI